MEQLVAEKALDEDCKLCPKFTHTFMILGKKWNGLIIEVLLEKGNMRFKDIANSITKCSDRVLCERLKELEDEQIVSRNTYEGSSRVDYSLTERGQELKPVMDAVHVWSDKWI
ncbi:helix-turn-helix transcriptional regulator [Limosilactobacillus sp. STM2_1]|uniref:Helix-turn-helix transcriptional regulator n=1 Tax=Limosilactobacillus rudii TaxID=2759755 RepID=A0A7W3UJ17_9LACO|nr:helix-turn-helix domain-containing protein [Limosilactobacillus rudii]MBB1080116.1 helix-turn-helix transcriptional regulator [Limosilactobacillus rudii]MBB1096396.1 helix-turn-helix transcriptional regulator [Limosilactobacillus rudii]MCD7133603.1 helix-turn-helix transcriptional regulator [Limosilactobacillus rudii]